MKLCGPRTLHSAQARLPSHCLPLNGQGRHLIALVDTEGGKTNPLREVTFLFVGVAVSLPARGSVPSFAVSDEFRAPSVAFWGRGGHGRPERNDHSLVENIFPVIDFMMHEYTCDNLLLCAWGAPHDAAVLRDFTSGCVWPCGWLDLLAWARLVSGNSLPGYSIDLLLARYVPSMQRRQTHTSMLDTLDMLLVVSGLAQEFPGEQGEQGGQEGQGTTQEVEAKASKGPIRSLFGVIGSSLIGECYLMRPRGLAREASAAESSASTTSDAPPSPKATAQEGGTEKQRGRSRRRSGNTKRETRPPLYTLVDAYAHRRLLSRSRSVDSSPCLLSPSLPLSYASRSFYKEDGLLEFILAGGQQQQPTRRVSTRSEGALDAALSGSTRAAVPAPEVAVADFPGQRGSATKVEYFSEGEVVYRIRKGWRKARHKLFRGFGLYRLTRNGTWRACSFEEKQIVLGAPERGRKEEKGREGERAHLKT